MYNEFQEVKTQVETIHEKIAGNQGIYDKVHTVNNDMKNLSVLPSIAQTLKLQTYIIGALFALIAFIIIKGANLKVSIPGLFEMHSNESSK